MPDYISEQEGLFGFVAKFIFRIIFYVLILLILVGDIITLVLSSIYNFIRNIFVFIVDVIDAIVSGVIRIVTSAFKLIWSPFHKSEEAKKEKVSIERVEYPETAISVSPKTTYQFAWHSFRIKFKYFVLGLIFALLIIFTERGYSFLVSLPNPRLIGNVNFPVSTQIYDRNGKLLYDVFRDEDRTPVDLNTIPDHIIQATIAIEDKSFYTHNGISPVGGILRAIKDMIITGDLQGGSTITQQLVKSSLLSPERTFERKFREAILALWAEQIFDKREILQMYLNQVPYGGSAYGIEEAAKTYFNKPATELSVNEAAFLAGLTRAPSRYSPFVNPQLAVRRRNEVLRSMFEIGYLTSAQYEAELQAPLTIEPPKTFIRAPHFVFYVKSLLEEQYGIRRVEEGGLRVMTTLDLDVQDEIEKVLDDELEKITHLNVSNGAVLVTAPSTGEVLAMVGSRNYFDEPYGAFNVTTARRQPGSSIKPLMYSLALEEQYTAASIVNDSPVAFEIPGGPTYRPVNYDSRFHGPVSIRFALANSYNIPAVKVLNTLGVDNFIKHATNMGISTWDTPERYGLSLTLGGAEVKMVDMAVAFGTFANYGTKIPLNPFLTVEDFRGNLLYELNTQEAEQVISPQTSFIISDILSDNFARKFAFGPNSDLVIPNYKVAAKTGTTNSKRDNWTIGYNRKYLTAVWVGNNDNTPMHPTLSSGVTGASPIWNRVMTHVLDTNIKITADVQPPAEFSVPPGIISKRCYFGQVEYFKVGTENSASCQGKLFGTTPGQGTPTPAQGQ